MLCFIFSGLLSDAAGALVVGVLVTVLLVGLAFFCVRAASDGRFSIAGYGTGFLLLLFLGYHVIPACGAMALRWKVDEVEVFVKDTIMTGQQFADVSELTPEESREVVDALVDNVPLVGNYIDRARLAGVSASAVATTISGQIRESLMSFILKSAGWSIAGLIVAAIIIYVTMEGRVKSRATARRAITTSSARRRTGRGRR